jgi:SAM-dependent methyltransferase
LQSALSNRKGPEGGKAQPTILDRHRQLGDFSNTKVELNVSFNKEADARKLIFDATTPSGVFFEVGGRDGELSYLLGVRQNLDFDRETYRANREAFDRKFRYVGNDLEPASDGGVLVQGDICSRDFMENSGFGEEFAAVVYSNNVFEHLRRPWIAAANIYKALQPGGVCVTIAPFSVRYHEVPGDYFRYTHMGLDSLFADAGPIETIAAGYDILGRRNNWQGLGAAKDIVPVDEFGAWRENWFTFHAFRKPAGRP